MKTSRTETPTPRRRRDLTIFERRENEEEGQDPPEPEVGHGLKALVREPRNRAANVVYLRPRNSPLDKRTQVEQPVVLTANATQPATEAPGGDTPRGRTAYMWIAVCKLAGQAWKIGRRPITIPTGPSTSRPLLALVSCLATLIVSLPFAIDAELARASSSTASAELASVHPPSRPQTQPVPAISIDAKPTSGRPAAKAKVVPNKPAESAKSPRLTDPAGPETWINAYCPLAGVSIPTDPDLMVGAPRTYRGEQARHLSIDLYAPYGTPVHAAAKGYVVYVSHDYSEPSEDFRNRMLDVCATHGDTPGSIYRLLVGRHVIVNCGILNGHYVEMHYNHLSWVPEGLKTGDRVEAGDLLGRVGNSGTSNGARGTHEDAHLDFQITIDEKPMGMGMASASQVAMFSRILRPMPACSLAPTVSSPVSQGGAMKLPRTPVRVRNGNADSPAPSPSPRTFDLPPAIVVDAAPEIDEGASASTVGSLTREADSSEATEPVAPSSSTTVKASEGFPLPEPAPIPSPDGASLDDTVQSSECRPPLSLQEHKPEQKGGDESAA